MLIRNFGPLELALVIVLAVLIFGPGRIGKLGSEIGKAISGFKREMGPKEPAAERAQDAD